MNAQQTNPDTSGDSGKDSGVAASSMTGFGRSERTGAGVQLSVEVRAVNARFLDLQFKAPRVYFPFESEVRSVIAAQCERGRVEVFVERQVVSDSAESVTVNQPLYTAYLSALLKEGEAAGATSSEFKGAAVLQVMQMKGVLEQVEAVHSNEQVLLLEAVSEACEQMVSMRRAEGLALKSVLEERLEELTNLREAVVVLAEGRAPKRFQELLAKVETMVAKQDIGVEPDAERLATELAVIADKLDVSEELARLVSHAAQMESALGSWPCGRKVEFLVQEMGREWNTLSVKAQNAEIQAHAVSAKSCLEKIREQALNLE